MLSHTYSGRTLRRVSVGGREVSELGLNAMVAHHLGVPVVLVTGDDAVAEEAREVVPEALVVTTKRALGRYAAMCPSRRRMLEEVGEAAFQAVKKVAEGRVRVGPPASPLDVEVEFTDPGMADVAHLVTGSVRVSPTTLRFRAEDALEAYRVVRAFTYLAISMAR